MKNNIKRMQKLIVKQVKAFNYAYCHLNWFFFLCSTIFNIILCAINSTAVMKLNTFI